MASRRVTAEVAGIVAEVMVSAGAAIGADTPVAMIECMKMLLPAVSPWAGRVTAVRVAEGDVVQQGQALVDLEV